jgi:hypothetical protein
MFGIIHRLFVEHSDDKENPLVYLQLCLPYHETGIYKAGKSYMIRSKTKNGCLSKIQELSRLENIIIDPNNPKPYSVAYGSYTINMHKKIYAEALGWYVQSITKLDDAFYYITDSDKKISYLKDKLNQLRPDYRSLLSVQLL